MNKSPQLKPLSNPELSAFSSQLSLILRSGISALEGISIMLEDASSEEEKAILNALSENLQETGSLNEALEQTQLFPAYMTRMVRIGEETGTLDDVMAALGDHYAREDTISRTIRSAVTYPMIIISMMIIVILVLIIKVMPIFNQVFIQLGSEMSGFSRVLMDLGNTINRYSVVFIAVLAVIVIGFFAYNHTAKGAAPCNKNAAGILPRKQARRQRHIPAIRRMHHDIASCRFASGMALTLKSGMAPEECLSLVRELNDDEAFQKELTECEQLLENGTDFTAALHQTGIFTGVYARMASIGFKTGSLDQVMSDIAELYQEDLDNRMSNTLSILEPTLVIALSLVVGFILLSVMLPLVGIMSSI